LSGGWIKLYRSIQEHWIWQDSEKLKWWLDLILLANHQNNKIILGNELLEVGRGEHHTSEIKLAERWKVSKTTVRKFLNLLENDAMIQLKKTKKGTTIKVCNYKEYQDFSDEEKIIKKLPENHKATIEEPCGDHMVYTNNKEKKDKKENNEKNDNKYSVGGTSGDFNIFLFMQQNGFVSISPVLMEKIQADIELYSMEEVRKAVEIADSNGKHTYNYIKGILENRRKGVNDKSQSQKELEAWVNE